MINNETPIFEIVAGVDHKHYKIFADGRTEGFDSPVYSDNNLMYLEWAAYHWKKLSGTPSPASGLTEFREGLLQIEAE